MTPEQEEQVRRLLASTPAESGVPADVAARLDATLAGLVAERADVDPAAPATVDELAERRRRRRWPRLLVAAATVSVVAYGVGVSLDGLSMSGGSADSATAARDESLAEGGDAPATDEEGAEGYAPEPDATGDSGGARADVLLTDEVVRLHRDSLTADVQRLLPVAAALDRQARTPQETAGFLSRCALPDTSRGDRLAAVRLDGKRATLVVRKAADGTHVAEVYSCADASRLLAVTEVDSGR